jgi:predicted dehydrogenase
MKKYRAAIIGCGRIASLFAADKKRKGIITHAQAYLANPQTKLVAACDRDSQRLAEFGERWGGTNLYTDFEQMLKKEKIDLLSICTWNATHASLVETAVKAGVKGIICEKPIADTLASADRMIRACRAKKVPLLINYTRRYVTLYRKIKTMIDHGELGQIQAISCYYTAGTINTGTHLFDFLRYFFGDVQWVWADPSKALGDHDKSFSGYLYFKKGFGCTLSALDVQSYLIFEADIYGTKKRLRITNSGAGAELWDVIPHPTFSGYRALSAGSPLKGDLGEGLPNLVKSLVKSVKKKSAVICSGADGRASLEIAVALHLSAGRSGVRVNLPVNATRFKLTSK